MQNRSWDFSFSRTNQTFWGNWLWTTDWFSTFLILILAAMGTLLVTAASPAVAETYNLSPFFFIKRHCAFLILGALVFLATSHLSPDNLRRTSILLAIPLLLLLLSTLFMGTAVKGAKRWLSFGPIKLQPSELLRPIFCILTAWLLSEQKRLSHIPSAGLACILLSAFIAPLLMQPDLGMTILVVTVFAIQLFIAGLPWRFILMGFFGGTSVLGLAIALLPHVRHRLHVFWNPDTLSIFEERFQITQSLKSFAKAGLWGLGPGEGRLKFHLPDAHTDFIMAVAAEEFGLLFCLGLLVIYACLVLSPLRHGLNNRNLFVTLSLVGLCSHLGIQVLINIASAVGLIPTKGMPLPFISYGGSSMLANAFLTGGLLALTRRRSSGLCDP